MNLEYLAHPALKEIKPLVEKIFRDLEIERHQLDQQKNELHLMQNQMREEISNLRSQVTVVAQDANVQSISQLKHFCQDLYDRLNLGGYSYNSNPLNKVY